MLSLCRLLSIVYWIGSATVLNGGFLIACPLCLYLLMTSQTKQATTDHEAYKYNYIYTIETIR